MGRVMAGIAPLVGGIFLSVRAAMASVTLGPGMLTAGGPGSPIDVILMPDGIRPNRDLQTLTDPMRNISEFSASDGFGQSLCLDAAFHNDMAAVQPGKSSVLHRTWTIEPMAIAVTTHFSLVTVDVGPPDQDLFRQAEILEGTNEELKRGSVQFIPANDNPRVSRTIPTR